MIGADVVVAPTAAVSEGAYAMHAASILDEAKLAQFAGMSGQSVLAGRARLAGGAVMSDNAYFSAGIEIAGEAQLRGYARIERAEHYMGGTIYGFSWDCYRTVEPDGVPRITLRFGCRPMCLDNWTPQACMRAASDMSGFQYEELACALEDIVSACTSLVGGIVKREKAGNA